MSGVVGNLVPLPLGMDILEDGPHADQHACNNISRCRVRVMFLKHTAQTGLHLPQSGVCGKVVTYSEFYIVNSPFKKDDNSYVVIFSKQAKKKKKVNVIHIPYLNTLFIQKQPPSSYFVTLKSSEN